ncbi:zinc-binding dehydrogenase [Convivina intestini]|uniref:Threonine dehydrogenase-like Zn-dependent dehydrogenase n=1 Tax=Convivina intestini TaxID=1505726 RepID=A0A2U1DEZ3_9LACO|nr:zinc-binding dehydrogenase [Convivina intestini]PVY86253.1 threonine dehydrogenase-like Zn-dependent dehydrogenase [Convivina intestini]CAH1851203.1 Alcohol dehydrogenase [Convivina intestini]SDB81891.1 Alcohol dehydrogenase GroES-like domain-containing protein [Leuconostocaceae bacterium R-53105]
MKDTIFIKAGRVEIQEVAKPEIQADDDVIIRVLMACVCGSDLWAYRGLDDKTTNSQNGGHEAIGIVEATGSAIDTVKAGDFVIAPFDHGCGHCAACLAGYEGSCLSHSDNYSSGNQAEYIRYQHGNWALVKIPGQPADYTAGMIKSFLTLADVMPTGYHGARTARVGKGDTAVVIGDGAVGLCGVIAAKMRGARRIIAMSRHEDRQKLALAFGATDIIAQRGDEAIQQVMSMTNGAGADAVLECVGTEESTATAFAIARPGATVGRVGLPHGKDQNLATTFRRNVSIAGGPASVTTYDKKILLQAVLNGEINPGKVFTQSFALADINSAYQAMVKREAIKSAVIVSPTELPVM